MYMYHINLIKSSQEFWSNTIQHEQHSEVTPTVKTTHQCYKSVIINIFTVYLSRSPLQRSPPECSFLRTTLHFH